MNFKKKYIILMVILFVICSISSVTANENQTIITNNIADENVDLNNINEYHTLETAKEISTTVSVYDITVDEGKSITLTASVYASGKKPTGTVYFSTSGKTIGSTSLYSSNYAKLNINNTYSPGKYEITARYSGGSANIDGIDYKFKSSSAKFNLIVKSEATLSGQNYNSFYKSGEKIQIKVTDNYNGKLLINKNIRVAFYRSSKAYDYSIYSIKTNDKGICEVNVNEVPGNYYIIANINEDCWKSNYLRLNVTVSKNTASLITNNIIGTAKSDIVLKVNAKDDYGNNLNYGAIEFTIANNKYDVEMKNGIATKSIKLDAGHYTCNVLYYSGNLYDAKVSSSFDVVVNKAKSPNISLNKWISTTKSYATLKVNVKDSNGNQINEGIVNFVVNGKTYNVNVKNGEAKIDVKLTSAKTYDYKATFSSNNYDSKSANSKVYVKKAKKNYKIKFGKYTAKLTYKQYLKLLNAKNNGKKESVSVKTGKYLKVKKPIYKTVKYKDPYMAFKKVLSFKSVSSYDWSDSTTYEYSLKKYFNSGWELYGWSDVESGGGHVLKSYAKLKKKFKYSTKKVKTGKYKTVKIPYKITLKTSGGIFSKDKLCLSTDNYYKEKKVNLITLNV